MNTVTLWFNLSKFLVMHNILSSQIKGICIGANNETFATIAEVATE